MTNVPLAAIVNNQFFCVHGGISPQLVLLDDIKSIKRTQETPQRGKLCDLLWSDPHTEFGNEHLKPNQLFIPNTNRGCSYYYTFNAVAQFLKANSLLSMIRAHEAQDTGFRTYKPTETNKFPALITLFSAPNYLDVYNNKGAVIVYENNILNAKQFGCASHPYWLPNFMDVFSWSLPFIAEKITEMLYAILNKFEDVDEPLERRTVIRQKIFAIGHLANIYKHIRSENEAILKLNGLSTPETSPLSSLVSAKISEKSRASLEDLRLRKLLGNDFTKSRRLSFDQAKELDRENELLPQNRKYSLNKI